MTPRLLKNNVKCQGHTAPYLLKGLDLSLSMK